ncbi:MAG: immunoglobulin domain-containing protein [Phycisphaerales bacterium]
MLQFHRFSLVLSIATASALAGHAHAGTWEFAPSMPAPKASSFAVNFNGAIYVIGGAPWMNGGDQDGSVYKFTGGAWTSAAPLTGMGPVLGQGGGVDSLNRIIVFGGLTTPDGDIAEGRAYEPVGGPYLTIPQVPVTIPPQNFGLAVDGQHRIYRLGGGCDDCLVNYGGCVRYDATTNSWQALAYLPYTRSSMAATYDGQGHIWGFGGYTSFGLPRIYDTIRYTIATNTWETLGSLFLPVQTSDARAALGADGRVYMIGGLAGAYTGIPTSTVYVLDPTSPDPVLTYAPPLNVARYDFAVALGNDNYLYVMGGVGASGALSSVERLYTAPCPTIGSQSSSQAVAVGQNVTLAATASGGAPLSYQWERNGAALVNGATGHGSTIAGATSLSLTITNFAAADAGTYTMTAANPCGTDTTGDIVLTVPMLGDLNHDHVVNASDLGILLGAWGTTNATADLNGDGSVDAQDLAILLGAWS